MARNTIITHYGGAVALPLTFTEEELRDVIDQYIDENKSFTFKSLCEYIVKEAGEEGKLQKEENNVYDCPIELTRKDQRHVVKLLWDLIWAHKVLIDFSDTTQKYGYGQFAFIVNEWQEDVDYSHED